MKTKECAFCLASFEYKGANGRKYCKSCVDGPPRRQLWISRILKYGINKPMFELMYADQKELCAIKSCTREAVCVDHDHETGLVRGLLCKRCNTVLHEIQYKLQDFLEYL